MADPINVQPASPTIQPAEDPLVKTVTDLAGAITTVTESLSGISPSKPPNKEQAQANAKATSRAKALAERARFQRNMMALGIIAALGGLYIWKQRKGG